MTDINNNQPVPAPTQQQINQPIVKTPFDKKVIFAVTGMVVLLAGGIILLRFQANKKIQQDSTEMKSTASSEASMGNKTSGFKTQGNTTMIQEEASPSPRQVTASSQPTVDRKASFYISLDKNNYTVGETFTVIVMVNGKGEKVDGAEFILTYDPTIISIGSPVIGTFFSIYPQKKVDPELKTVRVIALQKPDENKALGEEVMIRLPITALASGTVKLDFVKDKSHIAGYGGQELLETTVPATITIK
jgi:hypothetical protein